MFVIAIVIGSLVTALTINLVKQFTEKSPPLRKKEHPMKIVAVTACPTGIAHTYMAAESWKKTAKNSATPSRSRPGRDGNGKQADSGGN